MTQDNRSFIRHLRTLAVASGALAALPAPADTEAVHFAASLQDRIERIEAATRVATGTEGTATAGPTIPFNNYVFIRVVVPYNKFVPPTRPDGVASPVRRSAMEIFEAVRRA
jgi:hypothetical protein